MIHLMILMAALFVATDSFAQRYDAIRTPDERAKIRAERMAYRFQLDAQQQDELYKFYAKEFKERDEQRKEWLEKRDENMKKILNEEQYKAWKEYYDEAPRTRRGERPARYRDGSCTYDECCTPRGRGGHGRGRHDRGYYHSSCYR